MSYDLDDYAARNNSPRTYDLEFATRTPDFKVNNLSQYRFYNRTFKIGDKKYFVDFSYVVEFTGLPLEDYPDNYVKNIHCGFYINRNTGGLEKAHIWIKDPETNKRATPDIYEAFIKKMTQAIFVGYGYEVEADGMYYMPQIYVRSNLIIWGETK
jgi:hypothetical protein